MSKICISSRYQHHLYLRKRWKLNRYWRLNSYLDESESWHLFICCSLLKHFPAVSSLSVGSFDSLLEPHLFLHGEAYLSAAAAALSLLEPCVAPNPRIKPNIASCCRTTTLMHKCAYLMVSQEPSQYSYDFEKPNR